MTSSKDSTSEDWTDPRTIPLGYARGPRKAGDGTPDPRYIQANIFTIAQIGGAYDLLALEVERHHLSILVPWRLDSGAPRAIDYLVARDRKRSERTN